MKYRLSLAWIIIGGILIIVPLVWGLIALSKKSSGFLDKKYKLFKENRDIKKMKKELQEKKEEFINPEKAKNAQIKTTEWEDIWCSPSEELNTEEIKLQLKDEAELQEIKTNYLNEIKKTANTAPETFSLENWETKDSPTLDETPVLTEEQLKQLNGIILEAELLKSEGKFEACERKLIEGLTIDAENLEISRQLSDLYFTLWNHKKALSLLKKVTEKDPEDHQSIWQIGEIYFLTGDNETAEYLVDKAINLKNDNPKYYLTMVEIFYNTERLEDALSYMEKVIKLRPTNTTYLLTIAGLYEEFGNVENAKKYYFQVLEYEQNNQKAKNKIKELTAE